MNRRPADPPEWATPCPWCYATPGNRCTSPRGRRLQITSHDARINAHATANTYPGANQ